MFQCTLAIAALVASAAAAPTADHTAPAYAPAPYKPAPYHPAPYHPVAYKEPVDEPPKYEYTYAVADDYSKAAFQQSEARDNYATNGEYRVNLPDGRVQIVTYTVGDAVSYTHLTLPTIYSV